MHILNEFALYCGTPCLHISSRTISTLVRELEHVDVQTAGILVRSSPNAPILVCLHRNASPMRKPGGHIREVSGGELDGTSEQSIEKQEEGGCYYFGIGREGS